MRIVSFTCKGVLSQGQQSRASAPHPVVPGVALQFVGWDRHGSHCALYSAPAFGTAVGNTTRLSTNHDLIAEALSRRAARSDRRVQGRSRAEAIGAVYFGDFLVCVVYERGAGREIQPQALARLIGWKVTLKELALRMRCSNSVAGRTLRFWQWRGRDPRDTQEPALAREGVPAGCHLCANVQTPRYVRSIRFFWCECVGNLRRYRVRHDKNTETDEHSC
jgi:hypothetical protein